MATHSAEIPNVVCDPQEHALTHVPSPRELVYGDTDKDVETSLTIPTIGFLVAIPCAEILSRRFYMSLNTTLHVL